MAECLSPIDMHALVALVQAPSEDDKGAEVLPPEVIEAAWRAHDALSQLLYRERWARLPTLHGDTQMRSKAALPGMLQHAELASRMFAKTIREASDGRS